MVNTFIFDMDGTLIDTETTYYNAWKYVNEKYNLGISSETLISFIGMPKQTFDKMKKDIFSDDIDLIKINEERYAYYRESEKKEGIKVKSGIREILEYLKLRNFTLAVCTSTYSSRAIECLKETDLLKYFNVVITGDYIVNPKPDAEIYNKVLTALNKKPEECIAFEDTEVGILAATNANIKTIYIKDICKVRKEVEDMAFEKYDDMTQAMESIRKELDNKPSMLGYILDQPRALKACFDQKDVFVNSIVKLFKENNIKKVYILGSGTSYHASMAISNYFEKYLDVEAESCIPTEFSKYTNINNNKVYKNEEILVIGISQSGTSYSTVNALEMANKNGYMTLALTENLESMICDVADVIAHLLCGKERIPVETRGYSVTVFTGYVWAIEIARALNKISENEYLEIINNIEDTLNNYANYIDEVDKWYFKNQAELLNMTKAHIAAYGNNMCTAYEGVLKMYETFKKPLSAYEIEEMIHGPNMAFDSDTYIYMIASKEEDLARIPQFVNWFKENDVTKHVFVVSDSFNNHDEKNLIFSKPIFEDLSPIVYTLVFQIIAARNCIAVGIDTSVRPKNRLAFAHKYN